MDKNKWKSQPINIVIWGCNLFSTQLVKFLENTNIHVIGFITDEVAKAKTFCKKPVYLPAEWQEIPSYQHLPIVIANPRTMIFNRLLSRPKHAHQFKEKLQEISKVHKIQNQLLHPSALADFVPLRFRNKPILFGLQGSGNVLFSQIFLNICKFFFPLILTRDKRTFFFEMLCKEYLQIIQQVTLDYLHLNEAHDIHHVAWKIGTSHFNFKFGKNNIPASVFTFPTRDHFSSYVSLYHQLPSSEYLTKLLSMRFKIFFIIRNPLDIILSGLNKTGGINQETGEINDASFHAIASWVLRQLNIWHALMPHFNILRYEDLLTHPIVTIKNMMKQLQVIPFSFLAKKIWQTLGFKQLPTAFKNHFWKGGHGKWETFFKDKHFAILKAYGIETILQKYHYPEIIKRFNELTAEIDLSTISSINLHSLDGIYRDEKYDTYQFLIQQHGKNNCISCLSFYLVCHDNETLQKLYHIFNNTYFNQLSLAGILAMPSKGSR